jgi:hypothetical protein
MQFIDLSRSFFGCIRISRTGLAVFFTTLSPRRRRMFKVKKIPA